MKADTTTRVGRYTVPVVRARFATIVQFSGGAHGKRERGDFCFWTAKLKRKPKGQRAGKMQLIGRASVYFPPGERFDRIGWEAHGKTDASTYRYLWVSFLHRGRNIAYIRPSTRKEVLRWFETHGSDARHAYQMIIGGKMISAWR